MRTPYASPLALLLVAAALVPPGPALAQQPSAPWRTTATENFRIHYPEPWEPWALRLGGRLESILEVVSGEVGYRLEDPIDLVIADPESQSNGSAWPVLGGPRTVFWTRPPVADSVLAHSSDWGELLAIHEIAHLVHLGRPSRNPRRSLVERVVPFGPVGFKAPRWVTEGYATLVEGRLTGSGRPYGDQRAALIRRFALDGRLPSYPALASDSRSFLGMSMAYLVGSAYLEWLEARAEPGSLQRLWRRLSARTDRSFDDAFRGVYGSPPRELYGRFVVEVTGRALEAEEQIRGVGREGEVWLDLAWATGGPAVSPDGRRIAASRRERDRPAKLVVWELGEDTAARERRDQELAKNLERDPEDVAPIPEVLTTPRKIVASLEAPIDVPIAAGRWTPDSKQLLFARFPRGLDGIRHGDLFLWSVDDGGVRQVTKGADLSDGDPAPSGNWAVAVRSRFGATGLVRVDLASGAITELVADSIERVVDRPRVAPDGSSIAYLEQQEGRWRVRLLSLDPGQPTEGATSEIEVPDDGRVMDIAWSGSGAHLYAVVGRGGLVDIEALPVGPDVLWHQVTRTIGPVSRPAPTPDGKELYFLTLDPNGLDLRRLGLDAATEQLPELALEPGLAPVAVPEAIAPAVLANNPIEPGHPYRWGRAEWTWIAGGFGSNDGGPFELGVRGGDLLGRWDVLALGSVGDSLGPRGAAIVASTRRLPVELRMSLFDLDTRPSEGELSSTAPDLETRGLELRGGRRLERGNARIGIEAGVLLEETKTALGAEHDRQLAFAELELGARLGRGQWRLDPELGLAATTRLGGDDIPEWRRYRLGLVARHGRHGARLEWVRHETSAGAATQVHEIPSVGGTPSSLMPRSFEIGWGVNPALPRGGLIGERIDSHRLRLEPAFLPIALLAERFRVEGGEWVRLAGFEWRLAIDSMPLVRLPALEVRIGAARILDAPFEDETRWWAGMVVRP